VSAEREQALEEAAAMLDGWIAADEREGDLDSAETLRIAALCIRALKDPDGKEFCVCTGCTEAVERWSRSGLCFDCANEDCDHDDAEVAPKKTAATGARAGDGLAGGTAGDDGSPKGVSGDATNVAPEGDSRPDNRGDNRGEPGGEK